MRKEITDFDDVSKRKRNILSLPDSGLKKE